MPLKRTALLSAGACAIALGLAACGGSSSSSTGTTTPANSSATGATAAALVRLAPNSSLHHTVLVSSNGMTLYYLTGETSSHLMCTSQSCLGLWPPLYLPSGATAPTAVKGVTMSKLGTVKRPGGKLQVTYNGFPLYTFAGDTSAGQATGENMKSFGGTWLALSSTGAAAASGGSSGGTTGSTGGGSSSGGSSSSGGGWS